MLMGGEVRGSTPTDCARRLVPDRKDVMYELATLLGGIESSFTQRLDAYRLIIERTLHAPGAWIAGRKAELETLASSCVSSVQQWVRTIRERFQAHVRLLSSLDPKRVLARGYAVLKDATGRAVTSVSRLRAGTVALVHMKDGEAGVTVTRIGKQAIPTKQL